MTFTAAKTFQTIYRDEDGMTAFSVQPGKIGIHMVQLRSREELEELITALRAAAIEAGLPSKKRTQ
jgi:hypothetical protein